MHTIHYADGRYLTGDDIARAVIDCAQALAREGMAAATVMVPVRLPEGGVGEVEILIGPASQIVVEPAGPSEDELCDPEAVERIRISTARARESQSGTRVVAEQQDGLSVPGFEDLE
ncbi:hypothetical protein ACMT9U_09135 [Clavibacter sp. Sh2036]|uniref:hypothetical protein n=1 Tax=Clavibacter sp. Sh2036 TaxID=3397677 RepID=UPI0039E0EAE6